ncbi:MAG: hypothetical protein J0I80_15985 [Sphingomonas sp.]|nr:hypothetical protein [Sphingomonas sp.]
MNERTSRPIMTFAALALLGVTLALYWPGYATYDSVVQFRQVLDGQYDDWHPPVLARLWALLGGAHFGTGPMFVLQASLYWCGLGLLAERLRRMGRARAGWAVLALGLTPPIIGWQVVVLKDAQMLGAMLAATGLAGWWRLAGKRIPPAAWLLITILLIYAALVRSNAAFAVVPFFVLLTGPSLRWPGRALLMLGGIAIVLAASPLINRQLLRAADSGVTRSQAIYDLAGIAVRAGDALPEGAALRRADCVTPFFWDRLGEGNCGRATASWQAMRPSQLYRRLAMAILQHPLAYALQRLTHLNSTERWLVPAHWPNAAPPAASEPDRAGLAAPGRAASTAQAMLSFFTDMPIGWPICWVVAALLALWTAMKRPGDDIAELALALAGSTLMLEASFGIISIASDLRYHLWPMLAAGLALLLMVDRLDRRAAWIASAVLALLVASGASVRLMSPRVTIATAAIPIAAKAIALPLPSRG